MTPEQILKVLKLLKVKVPASQQRSGWVVASCPLAPFTHDGGTDIHPAFAVKKEDGDPACHCFACDFHGTLGELLIELHTFNRQHKLLELELSAALALIDEADNAFALDLDGPDIEEVLFGPKAKPHVFPEWWLNSFPPALEIGWAHAYLASRGVPDKVATALDIRADGNERRVCFPVRDFAGRLRGLHGRAVDADTEPRYRMYCQGGSNNPEIWLGEHWIDWERPLVVVEGPIDLASVYRVYRNVATPLFANPSAPKLRRMADCLEWITLFDRGKGGDAGRLKVGKLLAKDHVIQHLEPPPGRKDPGETTLDELVQLIAKYVKLDEILID